MTQSHNQLNINNLVWFLMRSNDKVFNAMKNSLVVNVFKNKLFSEHLVWSYNMNKHT